MTIPPTLRRLVLAQTAALALLVLPTQVFAIEYSLSAEVFTLPDPNGGAAITMWGYALCPGGFGATCDAPTAPGPALTVPAGDSTLIVHLRNNLPKPTSLVINGLIKPMTPVWDNEATGARPNMTARVRSFDVETPAGGVADYTWSAVKPGTYLYQSGTQPQVQVQMGLYGALARNFADAVGTSPAQAYAGLSYSNQATLLYSEIDPLLHEAVAAGTYGTAPGLTSTFHYAPKYFLINGSVYPNANSVLAPVGPSGTTLLRLLNAGLSTHVPTIQGNHWTVVAEDGKAHPYPAVQYSAMLPAAKTLDVTLMADAGGVSYPVIDRRLNLSNNGLADGGMLAYLNYPAAGANVGTGTVNGNVVPVALADAYSSAAGVSLSVGASEGVLLNDSDGDGLPLPIKAVAASGITTAGGSYTLKANGSFVYQPAVGFSGPDSFSYVATDGTAWSAPSIVTIAVSIPTAPSLASLDDFDRPQATTLGSLWLQTVGSNPAQPNLQINADQQAVASATNLGGLAIYDQAFTATQTVGLIQATPLANAALVLKATGGTAAAAPANYVRVRCEAGHGGEVVVATMMGGSNVSVYVKQAAFPELACNGNGSISAVVDAKGLVTTFVNGNYVGGVQLADVPAWKGTGKVGLQLQSVGTIVDGFAGGSL